MDTLNGIPTHILLVHAVVVLLPLAALLLVLTAVWPVARRHLAGANAVLSVGVVVLVPLTTSAGEWLEKHVEDSGLVEDHAELGDTALFVAIPIAVLALIIWWRGREIAAVEGARVAQPNVVTPVGGAAAAAPTATVARPTAQRRMLLAPESAVVSVVIAVLSVVAAGAAVYDTYLIGDSGAQATWQGEVSATTTVDGPTGDDE